MSLRDCYHELVTTTFLAFVRVSVDSVEFGLRSQKLKIGAIEELLNRRETVEINDTGQELKQSDANYIKMSIKCCFFWKLAWSNVYVVSCLSVFRLASFSTEARHVVKRFMWNLHSTACAGKPIQKNGFEYFLALIKRFKSSDSMY